MRLKGKVAIISGGARGMGATEARLFAREGAAVAFGDILEAEGKQLEAEINETGGRAVFVRLDVTSDSDWQRAIYVAVERFGRLDILVNNAAIYVSGNVEETTLEDWDRLMAVNAKGVFLGIKAAIPEMRRSGGGSIVNISSIAGLVGLNICTAYNASKAAVRLLTKSTAVQYAGYGIRANSVHPGPIDTDMQVDVHPSPESVAQRLSQIPLGRMGRTEEVAYGVLYLASDESSYVTGSELVIDGGATAW